MKDKDYLYIFLHIPKCAGTTIRYHIRKNLNEEEYLLITPVSLGFSEKDSYEDSIIYEKAIGKLINKLTQEQLAKIKLVLGHRIPYGMHKHFSKPVRYFTFFRNPAERTISMYNYKKAMYMDNIAKRVPIRPGIKKTLLIDSKVPEFKEWLENKYYKKGKPSKMTTHMFLRSLNYLEGGRLTKQKINNALKKFYFIGTLENYEEDSFYIYEKLGINKYFVDQNVARKVFTLKRSGKIVKLLQNLNRLDEKIYKAVVKRSIYLKDNLEDFKLITKKARKRKIRLPLTQLLYAPRDALGIIKALLTEKKNLIFAKK